MESVSSWDAKLYKSSFDGDIESLNDALAQGGRVTVRSSEGITPMLAAAERGHTDICSLLLAHGSNVNDQDTKGFTPLLAAAQNGHLNVCGLLLAHGSNVNEVVSVVKHTALHYAAVQGHNALVEALLSWGAEVNPQDHHAYTPLQFACQEGHLLCVLTLLKAGASLTLPNNEGSLPIHIAAEYNRLEIVRSVAAVQIR